MRASGSKSRWLETIAGVSRWRGPGAWRDGAEISCDGWGSGYVTARVKLKVPVLLPGLIGFPIPVRAHAGAVQEGRAN